MRDIVYVILCLAANKPADINSPDTHCPATLAKHYKTLQTLFKRKNPNQQDVSQLLDLEFSARRAFIDSNTIREEDRHKKVLEAYPCFKDIGHVSHCWIHVIQAKQCLSYQLLAPQWCIDMFVLVCWIFYRWWRSFIAFWIKKMPTSSMNWREDGKISARRCSFLVYGKRRWSPQWEWIKVSNDVLVLLVIRV